jgi:hypothetical protein
LSHLQELQTLKKNHILPKKYQLPKLPTNLSQKASKQPAPALKLRVTEHLMKFEPIQAKEFITKKPVIRNAKEESRRVLGDQFNPELLKKKEAEMKRLANEEELEVQDFFTNNIGAFGDL